MFPRTSRVRDVAKAVDYKGVLAFKQFSRNRSIRTERHRRDTVDAIFLWSPTPAAKINVHHREIRPVGFLSGKMENVSPLPRNRYLIGQRFRQCTKQHVKHAEE